MSATRNADQRVVVAPHSAKPDKRTTEAIERLRLDQVANVRFATNDEWDASWESAPYATFFESRHWAEVWMAYTAGRIRPSPHLVEFVDGNVAVLPLSLERRGPLALYRGSPADTYGGWLAAPSVFREYAVPLARILAGGFANIRWIGNPYVNIDRPAGSLSRMFETHILDLREGFGAARRRWSDGHRRSVSKAARQGVTVRIADSDKDWIAYFGVYEDSLRRWGPSATSKYGIRLFEALSSLPSGAVRLWVAEADGRMISGAVCMYGRNQVTYWHGATRAADFSKRPSHAVLSAAIRDACDLGLHSFDFGPSGGHEGVVSFKTHFGAEPTPIQLVDRSSLLMGVLRSLRSRARQTQRTLRQRALPT